VVKKLLEGLLGAPVVLQELKHKPGRRRTMRARGARRTAIVKLYASARAATVAARVSCLAAGPDEPRVPEVLAVEPALHMVVLSEVPGEPLRQSLIEGDVRGCRRAGAALGTWHSAWRAAKPGALKPHSPERELHILTQCAGAAAPEIGERVSELAECYELEWSPDTVVHRDLYEEQIMLADRIGLIDLDDAALGPPELDMGNLLAHISLLESRARCSLAPPVDALLQGYGATGPLLNDARLEACRELSLLRLACLHGERRLLEKTKALSSVDGLG